MQMKFLYNYFFRLLPVRKVNSDDELFLLSETEITSIKKHERIAIWLAALIGAIGVILLYIPQYYYPEWFPKTPVILFGKRFDLPLVMLGWSVLLVVIELLLLTFLNIWVVHEIAVATGFLSYQNKKHHNTRDLLINIGLEKKNKEITHYGIDPLQGMNRKALLLWNLVFILKATLSNFLFKFFIQRVLGRYALQAVQDFAGIPIFALWNAYGTKVILKEARVIIMGQNLVEEVCSKIKYDQASSPHFKSLLYDTLHFIAISKRDYHQNHYILTKNLFELYGLEVKPKKFVEKDYYQSLLAAGKEEKEVCQLLIVLGFLLDGKISYREKRQINELKKAGLLEMDDAAVKKYQKDFLEGRGVEDLIKIFIS